MNHFRESIVVSTERLVTAAKYIVPVKKMSFVVPHFVGENHFFGLFFVFRFSAGT